MVETGVVHKVENNGSPGASSVVVVEDGLSDQGWRQMHLVSGNEAALRAAADWRLSAVPWESAEDVCTRNYQEAGMWHIMVYWPLRGEPVKMVWSTSPEVDTTLMRPDGASACGSHPLEDRIILWTLTGKDRPVSEVVIQAAWYHLAYFDQYPDTAWVGARMAKLDGREVKGSLGAILIHAAHWMPEMGIGLGISDQGLGNQENGDCDAKTKS